MSNIYHSKIIQKGNGKENIHLTKMAKIKSLPNTYFSVIPKWVRQGVKLSRNKRNPSRMIPMLSLKMSFFFHLGFLFHEHSQITGLQGKGEGIPLTPHYHFHPLHRRLDISRAITAESSPLHVASSRTQTSNLWFPSASRKPLSYAP